MEKDSNGRNDEIESGFILVEVVGSDVEEDPNGEGALTKELGEAVNGPPRTLWGTDARRCASVAGNEGLVPDEFDIARVDDT